MCCALIRGAFGDTEKARRTLTTPPSATRSARRAHAVVSLQASAADPRGVTSIRHYTVIRDNPVVAHGRRNDPIASQFLVMRCPPNYPIFASWQWPLHPGCSLEAIDMT